MIGAPPLSPVASVPPAATFGLIIPGKPLRTGFVAIDATKYGLSFVLDVPVTSVRELVVFKMPQFNLPAGYGVLCYWQITAAATASMRTPMGSFGGGETTIHQQQRSTGFELLGALTDAQPSAIFQTGWSEHEQVAELIEAAAGGAGGGSPSAMVQLQVSIGVSLESLANIQNLGNAVADRVQQGKLFVAQKVAEDLFQFMLSFDSGHQQPAAMMVVPKNIFDRWFQRFQNRFQRDPNFFLRHQNHDG
jgi:hypothetical protein